MVSTERRPDYEGSPLHKRYPFAGKRPEVRPDKSECPPDVGYADAASILREGIRASLVAGWHTPAQDAWPQYAWGCTNFPTQAGASREIVWEARLTNAGNGTYKAYPCTRDRHADQMPAHVEEALWPSE